jgi:hypothetical protein
MTRNCLLNLLETRYVPSFGFNDEAAILNAQMTVRIAERYTNATAGPGYDCAMFGEMLTQLANHGLRIGESDMRMGDKLCHLGAIS